MSYIASLERRGCNGEQQNHCERSASSSQYRVSMLWFATGNVDE
jgi:hypothetical protein